MKQVVYMKIRKIEEELQTEYFKIIEDKEGEAPSVGKAKAPAGKQFMQEELAKARSEKA